VEQADPKDIVRRFYAELDQRHGAAVDELVSPEFAAHFSGRPPMGRDEFRQAIDGLYAAFPDLQHIVEDQVAEGDRVVTRLTERGTHLGLFQGIVPTGKQVTMAAISIHRIEGGRTAELWMVADALGRLQQLEGGPHPGPGSPRSPEPVI
jgi:predicted ester cyclase